MEHSLTYFLFKCYEFCFSLFVQLMIHPVLLLIIFSYHFAFSSLMLQVSLNNGTTFVSSNVNITTKNCPRPENNGTTFVSCDGNVTTKNCTQPVKPNEEREKETEPTKVCYIVVFTQDLRFLGYLLQLVTCNVFWLSFRYLQSATKLLRHCT